MQITIDLDEKLAKRIVSLERAMDRAAYKFTGMLIFKGASDKSVVEVAAQSLIQEGLEWAEDRYGKMLVKDAESRTRGTEEELKDEVI